MTKPLKVGVFGYYSYRNLGDNIMAYLVAMHVQKMGHVPVLYAKSPENFVGWGVHVCSGVREFLGQVDLVFVGGGGLLIPRPNLSGQGADFNKDLRELLDDAKAENIPMYGFSLGGAAKPLKDIVPRERRDLLEQLQYLTVRNRGDLPLLAEAGTEGAFFDDLVWTTGARFPIERPEKGQRRRIGFNLYIGGSTRYNVLRSVINIAARVRRDIDFIFIDIHPGKDGEFRAYAPKSPSENCFRESFVDVEESCQKASRLDLLFTTRLHLGVVAMGYGVPSIAYAAQEKTRLLYEKIGREDCFWKSSDVYKFAWLLLFPGALERYLRDERPLDRGIIDSALQHYDRMSEVLTRSSTRAGRKSAERAK